MELEKIRQHTAGTILQFSLPAIIAMVLTSLITVVDGFLLGTISAGRELRRSIWGCRLSTYFCQSD